MNNTIIVYPETIKFYLAGEDGWFPQFGHKVHVNGYDFSFTFTDIVAGLFIDVTVSDLSTGARLTSFLLTPKEVADSSTKEEAIKVLAKKAIKVAEIINMQGKEKMDEAISATFERIFVKYGGKPEYEIVEVTE